MTIGLASLREGLKKIKSSGKLNWSSRDFNKEIPAEKFVWANKEAQCAFSCFVGKSKVENYITSCHGSIQNSPNITGLISAYTGKGKYQKMWWDYITSPECFYYSLFDVPGWEILTDKGDMWGFKVPDELVKDGMRPFFYAFLIESRVPSDKCPNLQVWGQLVDTGVPKKVAHILMYDLQWTGSEFVKAGSSWGDAHLVINDTGSIMWKSFLENKVRTGLRLGERTTKLWLDKDGYNPANTLTLKIDWTNHGTQGLSGSIRAYTKYTYTPEQVVLIGQEVVKLINERYT